MVTRTNARATIGLFNVLFQNIPRRAQGAATTYGTVGRAKVESHSLSLSLYPATGTGGGGGEEEDHLLQPQPQPTLEFHTRPFSSNACGESPPRDSHGKHPWKRLSTFRSSLSKLACLGV